MMPITPATAAAAAITSCGFPVAAGMPIPLEVEVDGVPPAFPAVAVAVAVAVTPLATAPGPTLMRIPGVTVGTLVALRRSRLTRDS